MPEKPFNSRQESLDSLGASSLGGGSICRDSFVLAGACPLHTECSASSCATDPGDGNGSGVTDEEVSSVASSSSTVTDAQDTNLASGRNDEEAENTTDVPIAPPMSMWRPHSRERDGVNWLNRAPRLLEDTPEQASTSSGLGHYRSLQLMLLPEEAPEDVADPIAMENIPQQVQEPAGGMDVIRSPSIATFRVPGFAMGSGGGIVPYAEENFVEDPDEIGLENLNLFTRP